MKAPRLFLCQNGGETYADPDGIGTNNIKVSRSVEKSENNKENKGYVWFILVPSFLRSSKPPAVSFSKSTKDILPPVRGRDRPFP